MLSFRLNGSVVVFLLLRIVLAYTALSDSSLQLIPSPGKAFDIKDGTILAPLLKVRVPGTPGIVAVRQFFLDHFAKQLPAWRIELQNSTQKTPISADPIEFVNIIATRDPPWAKAGDVGRLALVAHYDSKIDPKGFIGATDSAAPCAMMLHAAKVIDAALTKKWADMVAKGETDGLDGETGIQILLLDGEEAFVAWTDQDSLYGARALAEEWETAVNPALSTYRSPLHSISLFFLLDLLGAKNPKIPSYFKTTHWVYKSMADLETRLREQKLFKSSPNHHLKQPKHADLPKGAIDIPVRPTREPLWFHEANKDPNTGQFIGGMVQDDHLPFMARGVEVLHVIPNPFPSVWHTIDDDGEHLDMETTEDWAVLTAAFAAEWMDLEGYLEKPIFGRSEDHMLDRRKPAVDIGAMDRSEL